MFHSPEIRPSYPRLVAAAFALAVLLAPRLEAARTGGDPEPVATLLGTAWNSSSQTLPNVRVRWRDVKTDEVAATGMTNQRGEFRLQTPSGGTFVTELVDSRGQVLAAGKTITIKPGETIVAVFVFAVSVSSGLADASGTSATVFGPLNPGTPNSSGTSPGTLGTSSGSPDTTAASTATTPDPPRVITSATGRGLGGQGEPPCSPGMASSSPRTNTIIGTAWDGGTRPLSNARIQLRNVTTGRVEAAATTNQFGEFQFTGVAACTLFLTEIVDNGGNVIGIGDSFTINPGEPIITFAHLRPRSGGALFGGLWGNTAIAAVAAAAGLGITAAEPCQCGALSPEQ